jgi:hypothetical protein
MNKHAQRVGEIAADKVNVALFTVFVLGSAFYLWTANDAVPLALHGGGSSPYNQLADAFIHLHLWVARAPAALQHLSEPYNPAEHAAFVSKYPDYSLYGSYLYLTWGPAPVVVLLVPLHLLGFEPSGSVIVTPFAIGGLAFALATLRVILRQVGPVKLWVVIVAALTLTCCSVVAFSVRSPTVYLEAVAGGYCFAMAAIWLALAAIATRRASVTRLVLTSSCFGLATGSRPTLGLTAVLLVAVYVALRATRSRLALLAALAGPFCCCLLLLAVYDQLRFGSPLEYGTKYQLSGAYTYLARFGKLSYVLPGAWSYLMAPPHFSVLFPFILLPVPQLSYPLSLPAHYYPLSEETGGLLPMAPISVFLVALPWIWRRRPHALGPLAFPLALMAAVGIVILLSLSYEFFATTERYEVDYTTLLLLGALATWLALSADATGRRHRRLIRIGGAVLAVWGCLAGTAITYREINKTRPDTWRTLVNLGAPVSTAIAAIVGHPVLAEVDTPNALPTTPASYGNLGTSLTAFWLSARDQAQLTIVSPNARKVVLAGDVDTGPALRPGAPVGVWARGPGQASHTYRVSTDGAEARILVQLRQGVNRMVLEPITKSVGAAEVLSPATAPESESYALIAITNLHLAGG